MAVHLFNNDPRNQFQARAEDVERWSSTHRFHVEGRTEAQVHYGFYDNLGNLQGLVFSKHEPLLTIAIDNQITLKRYQDDDEHWTPTAWEERAFADELASLDY